MRSYLFAVAALALLGINSVHGQGPLALRNNSLGPDLKDAPPVTYSVGIGGGYDRLDHKSSKSSEGDFDSAFMQSTVGATFNGVDEQTPWSLGLDLGGIYYFDGSMPTDNLNYSSRVMFNISHAVSERMKMSDSFFATYEIEPNFGVGAATARRNGQYLYGFNNFAISYAWSERFSTTTSYTVDTIHYDDSAIGDFEDRISHLVSQQFSWKHSPTTSWVAEYRFRTTLYNNNSSGDFMSHYVLAGIDQAWSERTAGSLRAGAEFLSSDRTNQTAPYGELTLDHRTSEKTTLRLYSSLSFDGAELRNNASRYSSRTGIDATTQVSDRLRITGGLSYVNSTFDGQAAAPDVTEHQLSVNAGIGYRIWDNVSLDASYSHALIQSDDELRDYSRDRISLGVQASF